MTDEKLREKVREAVRTGKLPNRRPDRTWGGPGVGAPCAICGASVEDHEVELEVEFTRRGDRTGRDRYHVHVRCMAAWEFELDGARAAIPAAMAGGKPAPDPDLALIRRALPETTNGCKIGGDGLGTTYKRGPA